MPSEDRIEPSLSHFINPHRLFHGMWMPQWLEERHEVSEKAKKLYAHLTYFAGGKGYAWPSFNHLAEKLHVSRRYVIRLVQELSAHRLITVTHVDNPAKGYCTNRYRFLWHPWMQTAKDRDFRMVVREEQASFPTGEPVPSSTPPSEPQITIPGELEDTSPGEPQITPLVIPSSPKENNKKRINYRGKVPATSSDTRPSQAHSTPAPPKRILSDTTKIVLERRNFSVASRPLANEFLPLASGQTMLSFPWQEPSHPEKKSFEERAAIYAVRDDSNWPIARNYLIEQRKISPNSWTL